MSRVLPCLALASFLAVSTASAQPGSLATWVDACGLDTDLEALLSHDALIVSASALHPVHGGNYRLDTELFDEVHGLNQTYELCTNAVFFGQTKVTHDPDVAFRSAVQVGPDLLLTAWHQPFDPGHLGNYRVIFGLRYSESGSLCVAPDFEHIPAAQVYMLDSVVADGLPPVGVDFLLLRLDRTVSETYPRVRRSGRGWPGDSMTVIGHSERMAAKVDTDGVAGAAATTAGIEALKLANLHALDGNSGSMIYNRTQRILETVASAGRGAQVAQQGACYVITHQTGYDSWNASLRHFAEHIPAFELLVESLDPVIHVAAPGGGIDPTNARTIKAPLTAEGPIEYQIVPPAPPAPGQPSLSIVADGPLTGTLSPGEELGVQETANIHGVACGFHERSYEIRDLTHGFTDLARQVFEIGIREFTVSGFERDAIQDLAAPFETQLAYRVSNPRPTAVVVRASASQNWLTFNGVQAANAGSLPLTVNLALDPGESAVLNVGIASWASSFLFPATYSAIVTFDIAPGGGPCPTIGEPVQRRIDFKYGTEEIAGPGGRIPLASSGSTLLVELPVNEDACLDDVDVAIATAGLLSDHLIARLTSPPGVRCLVWNQEGLPTPGPLVGTLSDGSPLEPYEPLAIFHDIQANGTWRFRLSNTTPGDPAPGTLESWSLVLTRKACP